MHVDSSDECWPGNFGARSSLSGPLKLVATGFLSSPLAPFILTLHSLNYSLSLYWTPHSPSPTSHSTVVDTYSIALVYSNSHRASTHLLPVLTFCQYSTVLIFCQYSSFSCSYKLCIINLYVKLITHTKFLFVCITVISIIVVHTVTIWFYFSLQIQPNKRISSESALRHNYFADLPPQIYELAAGMYSLCTWVGGFRRHKVDNNTVY